MAPLRKSPVKKTLNHFTHKHPLKEELEDTEFICDGCKTLGSGPKYHCKKCKFDLHDYCATCPMTLSSPLHPKHPLTLVAQAPGMTTVHGRPCDVCAEQVQGLFYACPTCDFIVHPLCTKFPLYVRHLIDSKHPLTFQSADPSFCNVCAGFCISWRYRCEPCGLNIHAECVVDIPFYAPPPPHIPPTSVLASFPSAGNGYACAVGTPSKYGQHYYQYQCQYNHQPIYYTPQASASTSGRRRKKVYELVARLAVGAVLTVVFGIPDISPLY